MGERLKTVAYYGYDERNSPRQVRLLLNVGGGAAGSGPVSGIHWHMNLGNEVTYVATDERRQIIPCVRFKDAQGNVTEYTARGAQITPARLPTPAQPRRPLPLQMRGLPRWQKLGARRRLRLTVIKGMRHRPVRRRIPFSPELYPAHE